MVHLGLLYKLKKYLPSTYFFLFGPYLADRHFKVRVGSKYSPVKAISVGVPQGSILGPHPADIPTHADDTAILSIHSEPSETSQFLQEHLNLKYSHPLAYKKN